MSVVDPSLLVREPVRRPHVHWPDAAIGGALVGLVAVRLAAVDPVAWSWYESLRRPSWAVAMPVLLGVGWLVISLASAAAAWIVVRRTEHRGVLIAWAAQVGLLLAWLWLLFWNGSLVRALVAAFALTVIAAVTVAGFVRVSRVAGALMIPALVWSAAALSITGGLAVLN